MASRTQAKERLLNMTGTNNHFSDSGPPVSEADLNDVENRIGRKLPDELRRLYLTTNGGRPQHRCFYDEKGGEHALHEFLVMKYPRSANTVLFEDTFCRLRDKGLLPPNSFPIAVNEGGDYYLLNGETGAVSFYAMDYSSDPSRALRQVAPSLTAFLSNMISDEEMFG
jgi:hypothetical protein